MICLPPRSQTKLVWTGVAFSSQLEEFLNLESTWLNRYGTEKETPVWDAERSSFVKALAKECTLTPGVVVWNPQAAISSVTPRRVVDGFVTDVSAEWQAS
jgi:hypothetical protein